jgi:pimeloyl-ACP methyl ester carboxylesterase
MRVRLLALMSAAALMPLALVVPSASADPVSSSGSRPKPVPDDVVPVIEWAPCGDELPGLECAVVDVPLDYDDPYGETTFLALSRVPAADAANKIGSVFVNPGGPGGSGVELVQGGFGQSLGAELQGRFDVVGFDPRGIAASDPLQCFATNDEADAFLTGQPVFPYRPEQFRPYYDRTAELSRRCNEPAPARIGAHMSTADVARDMDLLRRAVDDEALTYLGFSYGSYLGETYAALFPDKVRAVVIDGVLNPVLWSSGFQIVSDRVATQQVFDEFLRLCDEAGEACPFATPEGSSVRWEALTRSIRSTPLVGADGSEYTYDMLIGDATGATYAPEVWPQYAEFVDAVADAALGDPVAAASVAGLRDNLLRALGREDPPAEPYDNSVEAYSGNQCADTQYPSSLGAFRAFGLFAEAGSQFGPLWWWQNAACAKWPVNKDRYAGPFSARTAAPVLVVGNFFDGATDYAGAQAASRLLPGSRLLSYAGWGHTAYGRSRCTSDYVNAYLLDGTLPPEGTVCEANPNPLAPSAQRTSAAGQPLLGLPPAWLLDR